MIIGERLAELPDADATSALGARVAGHLRGGMVITLAGDLGTGKTTLVRGMLRALGWTGAVKSPTYTLVEHYSFSSLYFYHFDLYRLKDPAEWETAGFSDYFRIDAICVIEWPERASAFLPEADVSIYLAHTERGRSLRALSTTEAGDACLAAFDPLSA